MLIKDKLKKIKLFLTDVDGVLTDGSIFFGGDQIGYVRTFNINDGYGLKLLMRHGIEVGVISAGKSESLKHRLKDLGIKHTGLGNEDKRHSYLEIVKSLELDHEEVLYIGDDLFDIPLLAKAGIGVTVPHAPQQVKDHCDYTTARSGGHGAVREVVDLLFEAQEIKISIPMVDDLEN